MSTSWESWRCPPHPISPPLRCVAPAPSRAQAARKELESERGRLSKALDEAKKRLAKATKAQHTAELAAAEVRGAREGEFGRWTVRRSRSLWWRLSCLRRRCAASPSLSGSATRWSWRWPTSRPTACGATWSASRPSSGTTRAGRRCVAPGRRHLAGVQPGWLGRDELKLLGGVPAPRARHVAAAAADAAAHQGPGDPADARGGGHRHARRHAARAAPGGAQSVACCCCCCCVPACARPAIAALQCAPLTPPTQPTKPRRPRWRSCVWRSRAPRRGGWLPSSRALRRWRRLRRRTAARWRRCRGAWSCCSTRRQRRAGRRTSCATGGWVGGSVGRWVGACVVVGTEGWREGQQQRAGGRGRSRASAFLSAVTPLPRHMTRRQRRRAAIAAAACRHCGLLTCASLCVVPLRAQVRGPGGAAGAPPGAGPGRHPRGAEAAAGAGEPSGLELLKGATAALAQRWTGGGVAISWRWPSSTPSPHDETKRLRGAAAARTPTGGRSAGRGGGGQAGGGGAQGAERGHAGGQGRGGALCSLGFWRRAVCGW